MEGGWGEVGLVAWRCDFGERTTGESGGNWVLWY